MDRLRIVLCALTGFGNTVLDALLREPKVNVTGVFTVKNSNPFPYYRERQLIDVCEERSVVCYHSIKLSTDNGLRLLRHLSPHLVVVATFKQILSQEVLAVPPLGIVNFHPSLLPRYRGACPTNNAILNGDAQTGVTVHYMTPELDAGDILLQRSTLIEQDTYEGKLRQTLARLAGEMIPELVDLFTDFRKPPGRPQQACFATPAPKPLETDGYLEHEQDIDVITKKIRAYNPVPGTSILVGNERVAVDRFEMVGPSPGSDPRAVDVTIGSRSVRLFRKDETQRNNTSI